MLKQRHRGFTLIEILIAVVVLSIGLVGILAVFPTAIKKGAETAEDTYAGIFAQSVIDAVRVGVRENRGVDAADRQYFIFQHDGVLFDETVQPDGKPLTINNKTALQEAEWSLNGVIVLPKAPTPNNTIVGVEPIYVYPNTKGYDAKSSEAQFEELRQRIDQGLQQTVKDSASIKDYRSGRDPLDPAKGEFRALGRNDVHKDHIVGVYRVGGDIRRLQAKVQAEVDKGTAKKQEKKVMDDPYPYSAFALKLRRARIDSNGDGKIDVNDEFSDKLFEVTVMVFKNFSAFPKHQRNDPIKELSTLISL